MRAIWPVPAHIMCLAVGLCVLKTLYDIRVVFAVITGHATQLGPSLVWPRAEWYEMALSETGRALELLWSANHRPRTYCPDDVEYVYTVPAGHRDGSSYMSCSAASSM